MHQKPLPTFQGWLAGHARQAELPRRQERSLVPSLGDDVNALVMLMLMLMVGLTL